MTALDLIAHAKKKGLILALDGKRIRVRGVQADPDSRALVEEIRRRRDEVIEVLKSADVPTEITEGHIIAVEICSAVLEAHIWLAFDSHFRPEDGQAVFYADELPALKGKTLEQLRKIHKTKLTFGPDSMVTK